MGLKDNWPEGAPVKEASYPEGITQDPDNSGIGPVRIKQDPDGGDRPGL